MAERARVSELESPEPREDRKRPADVRGQTKTSRTIELQHAMLIISILIFVCAIFYAGRKFDYVKYVFMSRLQTQKLEGGPEKFPGVTSEELIESALAAEKRGDWQDATDRFIAAKRKNRTMSGILFRLGKSSYDRGDMSGAEIALDHAIRFGENLPVANYYRGLIAVHRHDLPAATRYFEAAANAEPFVADFITFGARPRLDQHPREAIKRYQQAVQRTPSTQDATLCRFKIRLAHIEAAEAPKIAAEVEEARKTGDLSVDWRNDRRRAPDSRRQNRRSHAAHFGSASERLVGLVSHLRRRHGFPQGRRDPPGDRRADRAANQSRRLTLELAKLSETTRQNQQNCPCSKEKIGARFGDSCRGQCGIKDRVGPGANQIPRSCFERANLATV